MIGSAGESILSRRSLPQPHPEIHRGGDCGACALSGALGVSVETVYKAFDSTGITNRHEMSRILRCTVPEFADRIIDTPAEWSVFTGCDSFGFPASFAFVAWFNYVRMAIDAGYYGLAMIDFAENGGPDTNHWVLICGARTKGAVVNELITGEIFASCSVRGEKWYDARDFLKRLGGYDILFVRPAK